MTRQTHPDLSNPVPHVVIIGGGLGGLNAAKALAGKPVRVTLLDRRNYQLFVPLLYQVATAAISAANVAVPIRSILHKQKNLTVLMAEVTTIDARRRAVVLASGERVLYDALIVAAGASHSYFGHEEWAALAPGLKSLDDALTVRRRLLSAFEAAERERDPGRRAELLSFVIVGGGPTGVELAGAIGEIAHHTLTRDFRSIDPTQTRILLVEAQPRLLSMFPEKLARRTVRDLERLGVTVRTGTLVTGIDEAGVFLGEERVQARTVLWAAGIQASPVVRTLGNDGLERTGLDRTGRVLVERDLSLPGHPEVFVVGDAAALDDERGQPLPGVAQVAIQQGAWAARNTLRRLDGSESRPFRYKNLGNMATIGRNRAIADIHGFTLAGFDAWLAWAGLHILKLVGFRNRLLVAVQWLLAYLTFHRGARLITGDERDPAPVPPRAAVSESIRDTALVAGHQSASFTHGGPNRR
ncbi:MAG: NAD(P)/FAD-dependent oxidoreductase [Chloroflexia bacterium]|nr:NAD(P)/FAD-dependent oxidoreductase [Chloroflexia bacterium]